MERNRVGFLGHEGVMALDLAGPIDAFTTATINDSRGRPESCYEAVIIGLNGKPFTSESGIVFRPHLTVQEATPLDTLIVPGGRGLRNPLVQGKAAAWIRSRAAGIRRIASVCTGVYALAATGLLDGRNMDEDPFRDTRDERMDTPGEGWGAMGREGVDFGEPAREP